MKLNYRGVSYDYTPANVEFSETNLVGKYRGLDIRFRKPTKTPVQQPTLDLVYRGAAYSTQPVVEPAIANAPVPATASAAVPAPALALSMEDRARSLMMNHTRFIKRRQQVMLTRLDAEVGLTARDAAGYRNLVQGKVHPTFRATYDRSHVAFS